MDTKTFFALYAERSEENFHKQFSQNFPRSYEEMKEQPEFSLYSLGPGLKHFPQLLKGNEEKFLSFLASVAENMAGCSGDDDKLYRKAVYELMEMLDGEVIFGYLQARANRNTDLFLAKKMVAIFRMCHAGMFQKKISKRIFMESLPKLAKNYPQTMRSIYTEVFIANREVLNSGFDVTKFRISMEEIYEKLTPDRRKK